MSKSLLSIQSHVVHGYVGGKAAIFPLQCQGWEVDGINTVNFSNHTGYGSFKGTSLKKQEIEDIFEGISNIGVEYNAIISGYVPNEELIASIAAYVKFMKSSSSLLYLLDPVMGDQGYLYVDKTCISQYKKLLSTKIVDIITPNQFELELLCEKKVQTVDDLKWCVNHIHKTYGVKYVVVSSLTDLEGLQSDYIYCATSTASYDNSINLFKIPIIKSYFTGVGDLFSALLLDKVYSNLQSNSYREGDKGLLVHSVNQVLTIMTKTLKLTHSLGLKAFNNDKASRSSSKVGKINDGDSMKYFELKIIQSREFFSYEGKGEYFPLELDSILQ
ncbi:putative pyridoxal kinase Bud16p [[Candida] railenensis]|uniref:pyridoxal kinase n=1 Tax=[Candida] railenensis TaxID=45579 RepID=A0A9P0QLE1_9ASCO|nr:putative pyridoxal kinase Bud16p [[Candida] railenensis]